MIRSKLTPWPFSYQFTICLFPRPETIITNIGAIRVEKRRENAWWFGFLGGHHWWVRAEERMGGWRVEGLERGDELRGPWNRFLCPYVRLRSGTDDGWVVIETVGLA